MLLSRLHGAGDGERLVRRVGVAEEAERDSRVLVAEAEVDGQVRSHAPVVLHEVELLPLFGEEVRRRDRLREGEGAVVEVVRQVVEGVSALQVEPGLVEELVEADVGRRTSARGCRVVQLRVSENWK